MTYNESDDQHSLLNEIRILEQKIADLDNELYDICMEKKFIRHRIADLEYELRTKNLHDHGLLHVDVDGLESN